MSRRGKAGQASMISMALYSAIIVVGISTVVLVGTPILEDMRDGQAVDAARDILTGLEEQVRDVADAGEGSSTTVGLRFARGDFIFDADDDTIRYELETESELIGPHTSQQIGGLRISSMADVSVTESTVNGQPCWKMENEHVSVCIRKIPVNTSELIGSDTVGYWRFNENSGDTAYDNSSYGNHGDINGTTWVDGTQRSALAFDGIDDYVNTGVDDLYDFDGDTSFSVSFWMNPTAADTGQRVLSTEESDGTGWTVRRTGNDQLQLVFRDGAGDVIDEIPVDIIPSTWQHVVFVRNGSTGQGYVNGVVNTTVNGIGNGVASTEPLVIGRKAGEDTGHWDAALDEVRIWNRSLSQDEVAWLYKQQGMLDYISTEDLVLRYYNKNQQESLDADFRVDLRTDGRVAFTNNGTGHVQPQMQGDGLGRAQIDAAVKSSFGVDYTIVFRLLSGSDFLQVDVDE